MVKKRLPVATGDNGTEGKDPKNGRFLPGNTFAKGNPLNQKAHQLRVSLLETVTEADMVAVTKRLIKMARDGDIHAIRELLDRVLGRPTASVELTVDQAKATIQEMSDDELLEIARANGGGQ